MAPRGRTGRAHASRADADDARRMWERAVSAPAWQDAPVWLHGDLHPANVVVRDGTLSGVIDFGELTAEDADAGGGSRRERG